MLGLKRHAEGRYERERTLDQLVPRHEVVFGVDAWEETGCGRLPGMVERMAGNVVIREQLFFQLLGQLIKRGTRVGVLRRAAHTFRRQLMGS